MSWLLKIFGGSATTLWLLAAAFAAGGAITGTVQGWRYGEQVQTINATHDKAMAEADNAALLKAGEYRLEEMRMEDNIRKAQNEREIATQNNQRIIDGLVAQRGELRTAIRDYAAGSGAAQDTVAACRREAATLGDVLESALQREEVATAAAETNAATARTLLAAWPRQAVK